VKFVLLCILLVISSSSYSIDPSGQTDGIAYSSSNVEHIDTSIVVSFVDKANLACETRDEKLFFNLFSYKVNFDLFRDKVNRHKRYGISSFKKEKLERYMSLTCRQLSYSSGSKVNFFQKPIMYEYGIIDLKKRIDSPADEPVWFTRLCVYQNGLCTLSIRAVVEKEELRIDEH